MGKDLRVPSTGPRQSRPVPTDDGEGWVLWCSVYVCWNGKGHGYSPGTPLFPDVTRDPVPTLLLRFFPLSVVPNPSSGSFRETPTTPPPSSTLTRSRGLEVRGLCTRRQGILKWICCVQVSILGIFKVLPVMSCDFQLVNREDSYPGFP